MLSSASIMRELLACRRRWIKPVAASATMQNTAASMTPAVVFRRGLGNGMTARQSINQPALSAAAISIRLTMVNKPLLRAAFRARLPPKNCPPGVF